ncbi:hypothetical protein GGI25_004412 [Coemansia spiralis]|uniref:Uncharacterized protein n=1 Tax=Coemansia spiralis TaxID=417178 RepID=A0A9W8KVK7_9FUNG|nr:hypothetical protein GGI25_004412 [Coemansia spiralis]
MEGRFENRVRDVTQQVYNAVVEGSRNAETRNKTTTMLVAELDTQMHELFAATQALATARINSTFDIGIRRRKQQQQSENHHH